MIFNDETNVFLKLPIHYTSILSRALIQACFSLKQDQYSPPKSVASAEFNLLQFANFLANSQQITPEQGKIAEKAFQATEENEEDNANETIK